MLIVLILIAVAVTLVVLVLLALLAVVIRREDRAPELAVRPPTLVKAFARRLAGLHVRRPPVRGPDDGVPPDSCAACSGTGRRAGEPDD